MAFLVRAGAMAPDIYHMSRLLEEMQGRTRVTTVLFYPGGIQGATGLGSDESTRPGADGELPRKIYSRSPERDDPVFDNGKDPGPRGRVGAEIVRERRRGWL